MLKLIQQMEISINYSTITEADFQSWLKMSQKLWDDYTETELTVELQQIYNSSNQHSFIAKNEQQEAIGFINISIRQDYVEGAAHSPTGYLEGIFVEESYRKKGVAKHLVQLGEKWLKANNCKQIGSDTWLWNTDSQAFHKKLGFWEEEKLVHFLKDIE